MAQLLCRHNGDLPRLRHLARSRLEFHHLGDHERYSGLYRGLFKLQQEGTALLRRRHDDLLLYRPDQSNFRSFQSSGHLDRVQSHVRLPGIFLVRNPERLPTDLPFCDTSPERRYHRIYRTFNLLVCTDHKNAVGEIQTESDLFCIRRNPSCHLPVKNESGCTVPLFSILNRNSAPAKANTGYAEIWRNTNAI